MALLDVLSLSRFVSLAYIILIWLVSLARKDARIVDMIWWLGFVLLGAGPTVREKGKAPCPFR